MNYKAYAAELLGTAALTGAVLAALGGELPIATPVAAGLTLTLFVYTIGAVSGSHINPAVTIGLLSIKKISTHDALFYIIAQVLGACIALTAFMAMGLSIVNVGAGDSSGILFGEALGAFFLLFGICSVVYGKVSDVASGLVIGGSLLLGIVMAASFSNGVLNPAVAIGIGSVSLTYIVAPIIGAIVAAQFSQWLQS